MICRRIWRRNRHIAILLCLVTVAIVVVMVPISNKIRLPLAPSNQPHKQLIYNAFIADRKLHSTRVTTDIPTTASALGQISDTDLKTSGTHSKATKTLVHPSSSRDSSSPIITLKTASNRKSTEMHSSSTATFRKPKTESDIPSDRNCAPRFNPDAIKTPFKFYIYDMPSYFNVDLQNLVTTNQQYSFCYNLDYCGMGEELNRYSNKLATLNKRQSSTAEHNTPDETYDISVRNTHQFSLEVIMHHKLLHSPYRTLHPERADIFYIPAYTALKCNTAYNNAGQFIDDVYEYLQNSTYFRQSKPHFSTLGKIQREESGTTCPLLRHSEAEKITYVAIEKESNPGWHTLSYNHGRSIIVAPYPSYIHFVRTAQASALHESKGKQTITNINNTNFFLDVPSLPQRNVFLLFAAGTRRSNLFRAKLIDQFSNKTEQSYEEFFNIPTALNEATGTKLRHQDQVMLITIECSQKHRSTTIPWMLHSVFCLQPAGDSPTRKSFYDSILSGCIPVLFTERFPTTYPFQQWLQYDQFTITLDEELVSKNETEVLTILKAVPEDKIEHLHNNLRRVAKWFQYSIPPAGPQTDDDAVTLILQEVQQMYNLTGTK